MVFTFSISSLTSNSSGPLCFFLASIGICIGDTTAHLLPGGLFCLSLFLSLYTNRRYPGAGIWSSHCFFLFDHSLPCLFLSDDPHEYNVHWVHISAYHPSYFPPHDSWIRKILGWWRLFSCHWLSLLAYLEWISRRMEGLSSSSSLPIWANSSSTGTPWGSSMFGMDLKSSGACA